MADPDGEGGQRGARDGPGEGLEGFVVDDGFLDTIGKTDFACLTPEEYAAFLTTFQTHFVEEIRRLVEPA